MIFPTGAGLYDVRTMIPNSATSSRAIDVNPVNAKWMPVVGIALWLFGIMVIHAQEQETPAAPVLSGIHPWLEEDFPWFSMTLDLSGLINDKAQSKKPGHATEMKPVVVRGLVFPLQNGIWTVWDADLLRWAAAWMPKPGQMPVDFSGMAPLSYKNPGTKAGAGHGAISSAAGTQITGLPAVAGISLGNAGFSDPRPPGPDAREPGRGPLPADWGLWDGMRDLGKQGEVLYNAQGTFISESPMATPGGWGRHIRFRNNSNNIRLALTDDSITRESLQVDVSATFDGWRISRTEAGIHYLQIPGGLEFGEIVVDYHRRGTPAQEVSGIAFHKGPGKDRPLWSLSRSGSATHHKSGHMEISDYSMPQLPDGMRSVRPSGMCFLDGDTSIIVTFDGDVWKVRGHAGRDGRPADSLTWTKIASGLHEPQSVVSNGEGVYVFTRNGLMRLAVSSASPDGRVTFYENFNNQFSQSAETREFPMDMVVDKTGTFYLAKGGQMASAQGRHNASVLAVAGRQMPAEIYATGLRQAYLGYDRDRDLLTASDQQGNFVPSTPFIHLKRGGFYGFRTGVDQTMVMEPVNEPLAWIPHNILQSGAGQVYVPSDSPSPLAGRMIYLDHFRSQLFLTYPNGGKVPTQAAMTRLPIDLNSPVLKGCVNPGDGSVWLTGFKIWGSNADTWAGLTRIDFRQFPESVPTNVRSHAQGILMEFTRPVQSIPAFASGEFSLEAWNYQRTPKYGSGRFRQDGSPGTESIEITGVEISGDRRSLFLKTTPLKPVHQLELTWMADLGGQELNSGTAWLTIHQSDDFPLTPYNFSRPGKLIRDNKMQENQQTVANGAAENPVSAGRGRSIYQSLGCMACHSIDGTTAGRSGPTLLSVAGKVREFADGSRTIADEAYIRESILDPTARIVRGFETGDVGMPSYTGILDNSQIESLVFFIQSLK